MAKKIQEIKYSDLLQGPFTVTVPIRMTKQMAEMLEAAAAADDGRNTSQIIRLLSAKYLREQGYAK